MSMAPYLKEDHDVRDLLEKEFLIALAGSCALQRAQVSYAHHIMLCGKRCESDDLYQELFRRETFSMP